MSDLINFDKLLEIMGAVAEKAIEDTAIQVQTDARTMVPYDTGQLHDSIQIEKIADNTFQVSANTNYAHYVHEGYVDSTGAFKAGIPYLTVPLQQHVQKVAETMKNLMPARITL